MLAGLGYEPQRPKSCQVPTVLKCSTDYLQSPSALATRADQDQKFFFKISQNIGGPPKSIPKDSLQHVPVKGSMIECLGTCESHK